MDIDMDIEITPEKKQARKRSNDALKVHLYNVDETLMRFAMAYVRIWKMLNGKPAKITVRAWNKIEPTEDDTDRVMESVELLGFVDLDAFKSAYMLMRRQIPKKDRIPELERKRGK